MNFPLRGHPYFSAEAFFGNHALVMSFFDGAWRVVDPTIYNTTYHNPRIPSGLETRAIADEIKHYQIRHIHPTVKFIDRPWGYEHLKDEEKIFEKKKRLKFRSIDYENTKNTAILTPRVDPKSIEVLP